MKTTSSAIGTMALILSLGCIVNAWANDTELGNSPTIEPVGTPGTIEQANIANRLTWAGISLINPDYRYIPVPLYGYKISDLNNEFLAEILPEAAEADIRIVIINVPTDDETDYSGQAIQVSKGEIFSANTIHDELFDFIGGLDWNPPAGQTIGNSLIAFSQPLREELLGENINEQRFMASADLWRSMSPAQR